MTAEVAAAYLMLPVDAFLALPVTPCEAHGRHVRWDRRSIDLFVSRLSGVEDVAGDPPDLDARLAAFAAS